MHLQGHQRWIVFALWQVAYLLIAPNECKYIEAVIYVCLGRDHVCNLNLFVFF